MTTTGDGNGQEPTTSAPDSRNGQEPAASQVPSPARDSSGNGSTAPTSISSLEDALAALEAARRENAKYRKDGKRLAELEAAESQRQEAALSEKERYDKKLADYQTKLADLERARQETAVRADIKLAASSLGIKPELARRILDYSAIEYDEDGDPKNVADLLGAAAAEYGLLPDSGSSNGTRQQQQPTSQQPTSIGAAVNPSRSAISSGALSWDWIDTLSASQIASLPDARRAEIIQWVAAHPRGARS